jgi:hypothetical protein
MLSKNKFFRVLSIAIVSVLLLSALPQTVAFAKTQSEAIDWVIAQKGKYIDVDGAYGAQCVDFTKAYIKFFGSNINGNAFQYAAGQSKTLDGKTYKSVGVPAGFSRYAKDKIPGGKLLPGDIFINTTSGGGYGHVGIVIKESSDFKNFTSIEQNGKTGKNSKGHNVDPVQEINHKNYTIWGILRPNYDNPPTPAPDPNKVTDVTSEFAGKTITLKSVQNGKYVSVWNKPENRPVFAQVDKASTADSSWEKLTVSKVTSDGWVGLKASVNGKYLSVNIKLFPVSIVIEATASNIKEAQSFKIYKKGNDYYLQSKINKQYVTVVTGKSDNPLEAIGADLGKSERFAIEIVNADLSGSYFIKSAANSEFVLNVYTTRTPKSADNVTMYALDINDVAMIWNLKKSGDAYIVNSVVTPVLNVYRDGTAKSGDNVNVYKPVQGDNNQLWIFESVGDDQYVIRSNSNPDCVLTAAGMSNKANVTVQTYTGADSQKWTLTKR